MKNVNRPLLPGVMPVCVALLLAAAGATRAELPPEVHTVFQSRCLDCHDSDTKKGNFDLTALRTDFTDAENFARWVKVHDRIASGEMPPKKSARPPAKDTTSVVKALRESLLAAEQARLAGTGRTGLRRLTRAEYENTIRDLFDMPGIALQGSRRGHGGLR